MRFLRWHAIRVVRLSFNLGTNNQLFTPIRRATIRKREVDSGFARKNWGESRTSDSSVRRETECERNSNVREYSRNVIARVLGGTLRNLFTSCRWQIETNIDLIESNLLRISWCFAFTANSQRRPNNYRYWPNNYPYLFFSYLFLLFSFSFLSRLKSWLVYLFHIRCKKKNMIKKKEEKKSRKKNLWYTWVIKWLRKSCVYTRSTLFLPKCNTIPIHRLSLLPHFPSFLLLPLLLYFDTKV